MAGITVRIGADTDQLESALRRSKSQLGQLSREFKDGAIQAAKYGAAAAAAGAALGAAMVSQSLKAVDALAKTSDKLGIATEALQGLRHAAELTGVGTNQLEMGLQRMTRRVSEAAQGMGEAQDAIKELGLSATELVRLSPDQQFRAITEAMEGVTSQSDKIRLAFKLFDSEGVNLVNTMAMGAEKLDEVTGEIEAMGLAMTRVDAAQIEAANDSFTRVGAVVDGISNQMAVELAPVLEAVAKLFLQSAREAGGMGSVAADASNKIIDGVAFALDAVEGLRRGFQVAGKSLAMLGIGAAGVGLKIADGLTNKPIEAINSLIEAYNRLPWIDDVEEFKTLGLTGIGQSIKAEMAIAEAAIEIAAQDIQDTLLAPMPGANFKRYVEETKANAQAAAEELAASGVPALLDPTGGTARDGEERDTSVGDALRQQMNERLELIREAGMTELEIMAEKAELEQAAINASREQQLITTEEFFLLMQDSRKRHADAMIDLEKTEAKAKQDILQNHLSKASTLMNTGSRKLFEIGKAAAISNALIDAYAAITGSYKVGARIGGPPLGAAYAAASAAATFAQISAIRSQSYGGGGGGASGGGSATSNINEQSAPVARQQPVERTVANVNLVGDVFSRQTIIGLIEQMNELGDDGMQLRLT